MFPKITYKLIDPNMRTIKGGTSGTPPTGVGGPKSYLRFKEPKVAFATSRSRRRIHPPTRSGAFCVVVRTLQACVFSKYFVFFFY